MNASALTDIGLLLLRLVPGSLMLVRHGWPKLTRFFGDEPPAFSDPIGLGELPSLILVVFAEFFCSIAVIFGLYTRISVIPLIITMAVAAFIVHAEGPFSKMEFPILYLVIFLVLGLTGPGKHSLDAWIRKKN